MEKSYYFEVFSHSSESNPQFYDNKLTFCIFSRIL